MSSFTTEEISYLQSQRLGRLATVDAAGNPDVVPVGFRYHPDLDSIDIGGLDIAQSKKWRDIVATGRAAEPAEWSNRALAARASAKRRSFDDSGPVGGVDV
jgi:PPOX class F420-dependent enzyme/OxyR family protein